MFTSEESALMAPPVASSASFSSNVQSRMGNEICEFVKEMAPPAYPWFFVNVHCESRRLELFTDMPLPLFSTNRVSRRLRSPVSKAAIPLSQFFSRTQLAIMTLVSRTQEMPPPEF